MIIKIVISPQIEFLLSSLTYDLRDIIERRLEIMNESLEEEYECRDDDGVINPLALENWQMDLDNTFVILSHEYFRS